LLSVGLAGLGLTTVNLSTKFEVYFRSLQRYEKIQNLENGVVWGS